MSKFLHYATIVVAVLSNHALFPAIHQVAALSERSTYRVQ